MDPITLALANKYTAETAEGMGAVQGKPGKDGFSPTVAVSEITGGHNVTITDASGPHSFDVMDGESGSGTGEDSFVTFKDQTISTPSELQTAIGHRPYYGCIHAINTRILGIAFTNDIVWISYQLVSGTYYLDLVTVDGLCEAWSSADFSTAFSSISSTKFLLEDELDLAEGTTFIGYFISPPEVSSTVSMHPDWFIGKKPTVGEQYRGKARNNVNKWWDMVVNVVGTFDNEGITMYTVEVVSVTEIGELPAGGTTDQILAKKTDSDYDFKWVDAPQGGGGDSAVLVKSPIGTIVIWSGTADNIPTGWQLCDGTNGAPDLRDKFVLGAGTSHAVGSTGGSEEVTLTVEQMPEHNHTYYGASKGVAVNSGSGLSDVRANKMQYSTGVSGSSQPHPNMPPYYALCYIMKLTADETDGVTMDQVNAAIQEAINASMAQTNIPTGGIIAWSGTTAPDGWALCDGTNGTPDLRGRFILGNSSSHAIGSTGGDEEVTLTLAQMPTHSHEITVIKAGSTVQYQSGTTNITPFGGTRTTITKDTGSSQPHNNMPPYYTLAYIMKL